MNTYWGWQVILSASGHVQASLWLAALEHFVPSTSVIMNSEPELLSQCYDNEPPLIYKIGFDNRLAFSFTTLRSKI